MQAIRGVSAAKEQLKPAFQAREDRGRKKRKKDMWKAMGSRPQCAQFKRKKYRAMPLLGARTLESDVSR
jgi:hypothetical protein